MAARQQTHGNQFVVYQPQIENWKDFRDLTWRMAVGITPKGGKEVLGVLDMQGKTTVDFDKKSVVISDMEIAGTHFQAENAERMAELVKPLSQGSVTMSLHRLVSCTPKTQATPGVKLNNVRPGFFVGYDPSILLNVNGAPVLSEITATNLKYVVNTHWAIFFDGANYYMPVGQLWLTSSSLEGHWTRLGRSREMPKAVAEQRWSALKKMVPPPAKPAGPVPAVFYSDKPADYHSLRWPAGIHTDSRDTADVCHEHGQRRLRLYSDAGGLLPDWWPLVWCEEPGGAMNFCDSELAG